jgi:hypothetical protein
MARASTGSTRRIAMPKPSTALCRPAATDLASSVPSENAARDCQSNE